jgi:metal-sulfur cluster biosynthetic enzyme
MPVSVVDLGLIYGVEVREENGEQYATVEMTLTYSGCPAREMLTNDVRCAALSAGVDEAEVRLRYSPNWNVNMVTEQGREDLREFGLSV